MIKLKQLICEIENSNLENELIVNSQGQSVSVSIYGVSTASVSRMRRPSTAGIDNVEGNKWWVSRVLVSDPEMRRMGIGL